MRILLLSILLFFAHNTSTSNTIITSIKAMTPGIAVSMASGAAMEIICPFSKNGQIHPLHFPVMAVIAILSIADASHNLEKAHISGSISFITSIAASVAGLYSYVIGAGIVGGIAGAIKEVFVPWQTKFNKLIAAIERYEKNHQCNTKNS